MRTSAAANLRNRAYRSNLRSLIRQAKETEKPEEAQEKLRAVTSMLDKMTRKGIVNKNFAANHKSKLHRRVNKLST